MKQVYRFRVGVRPLAGQKKLAEYDITHAAFLINTDLFEYGTDKKAMIASSLKNMVEKSLFKLHLVT